jgi:carboxymethylenebutenolidase
MLEFEIRDQPVSAYLAVPPSGQGTGIVVLHAWWGLTDFFRQVCDRLAEEGYVALAPDLYHGRTADTIEDAKRLRGNLDRKTATKELRGAIDHLLTHQAVNSSEVGAIGFSLGCSFALEAARSRPKAVKAVALFYGTGGGKFDKTQATYLGHFAEHDQWGADRKRVQKLEERLRAAQREFTAHSYAGTEHWFFEEDRPQAYDEGAARLAWERTIDFLRTQLE